MNAQQFLANMLSKVEEAVKRLIDAGNKRDFEAIGSIVADDFVWTELFLGHKQGVGREAFKSGVKSFLDGVPDAQFTVQNILSDDIRGGVRTDPDTNREWWTTTRNLSGLHRIERGWSHS